MIRIVTVQPIAFIAQKHYLPLTYFTTQNVDTGNIVEISVRNKVLPAIVVDVREAAVNKLLLKSNKLKLKKISRLQLKSPSFSPELLTLANILSRYYIEPAGCILKAFVFSPQISLPIRAQFENPTEYIHYNREICIGPKYNRLQYYEKVIRECFAKNKSIAIITPTILYADYLHSIFKKLPRMCFVLHSKIPAKKIREIIIELHASKLPFLLIGTPPAIANLSQKIGIVIVEDSDSQHYVRFEHPYINFAKAINIFAQLTQTKIIEGKEYPSLEDIYKNNPINYLSSRKKSLIKLALVSLPKSGPLNYFSESIRATLESSGKIIIYTSRKGLYSFVICNNCSFILRCPQCNHYLTLHADNERYYSCHRCQKTYSGNLRCTQCNGWDLRGYGAGTEYVAREIKNNYPGRSFWIFDEVKIKIRRQRKEIVAEFLKSYDGILIGTDMILEEPLLKAEHIILLNLDNLFSIPDFRINERIMTILTRLEQISEISFTIQTRFETHPVFRYFIGGNIKHFLEEELGERKREGLPPISVLVKILFNYRNAKEELQKTEMIDKKLEPLVGKTSSHLFFNQKTKNGWDRSILITVDSDKWVENHEELRQKLFEVTSIADVAVDPVSIL